MVAPLAPAGELAPPNREVPATERVGSTGVGGAATEGGAARGGTTPTVGTPPRPSAVGCARPPPFVPPKPEEGTGVISLGDPKSPGPLSTSAPTPGRDPEPENFPDTFSTPLVIVANTSLPTEWVCTGTPSARRASAVLIDDAELGPSPLLVGASSAPPARRIKERLFWEEPHPRKEENLPLTGFSRPDELRRRLLELVDASRPAMPMAAANASPPNDWT